MKRIVLSLCLLLLCAGMLLAQSAPVVVPAPTATLPANAFLAGIGYQQAATPSQVSGWTEICHRNPDVSLMGMTVPSYLCNANDYTPQGTSTRADLNLVVMHKGPLDAGTKTGAGAAFNANTLGGSFALGGWAMVNLSKLVNVAGAKLAFSVTWQKDDVVSAVQGQPKNILRALGSRAAFRFGFGRTF